MTITIQLTRGYTTIVDDCDADLATLKWAAYAGTNGVVYAFRSEGQKKGEKHRTVYLHRVILSRIEGRPLERSELVDHEDLNGLNNRRSNIRRATHTENMRNRRSWGSSGFKGVSLIKRTGKWRAQIGIDRKVKNLGDFDTPELAHQAYCAAALVHFGPYAHDGTRPLRLADAPVATRQLSLFDDLERAS